MQSGDITWLILPFQSVSGCIQRRMFDTVSPVTLCHEGIPPSRISLWMPLFYSVICSQILAERGPALEGVWETATIFLSLKPGIPKVGSGITSKFSGY